MHNYHPMSDQVCEEVQQMLSRRFKLLLRGFYGSSDSLLVSFQCHHVISFQIPCEDYHQESCNHSKPLPLITFTVVSQMTLSPLTDD